ncbi:glycosyltransferase [Candidatus Bathyarchaeota archaeon]|nr:glycosyltransferase [Candidatus Bathyarchaeota archaeon]
MKISVVICTKNRVQELMRCIKSVIAQSLSLDELIIVDAGDTEKAYLKIKEEFPNDSRFKYIHTFPSYLTADRNTGVRNSSGDIIIFLDDDTVVDKDFIKEVAKVFEKDHEKKIGGVMGNMVNVQRPNNILSNLNLAIRRIFLLPTLGSGRFRCSGCPTFIHGAKETKNVEFLSGCCMAYRRKVFNDLKFDTGFLEAHLCTDDEDFSYRVSRKYQNVYTPYAKLVHNPSPIGRDTRYTRTKMTVEARYYLLKKNFPQTLKHTLAFWWSVIGLIVQAATTMDKESLKGLIRGLAAIKRPFIK